MSDHERSVSDRFKESPLMVTLTTIVLVGSAATALANFTGFWDRAHTSQAELLDALHVHQSEPHQLAQTMIEENRRENRCLNVDLKISIIEQQIWQMEQSGESSQRLVEKKRELRKLEEKRQTLNCASFD